MDFLTIDIVKQYCRIDLYSEDEKEQKRINDTVRICANKGEEAVYDEIGLNYFQIIREYGKVPSPIRHASLIATSEFLIGERNPEENYAFKLLLKPYKRKKTKQ